MERWAVEATGRDSELYWCSWLPVLANWRSAAEAGNAVSSGDSQMWVFPGSWLPVRIWLLIPLRRLLPQLCFWVIVYISSFPSQKSQESPCSGVGWSLVVRVGKSQVNLRTAHTRGSVHHSSSPPFEEDISKEWQATTIYQLVRFTFSAYGQSFGRRRGTREGWELSFFTVFSALPLKTRATRFFSMNPLTVLYLRTHSSPLTPHFYNSGRAEKGVGLKWERQYVPHASERRHGLLLKTHPCRGKTQVGEVSVLLHPSCPDCKGRSAGNTTSDAGKEFGDCHTIHKQVNICFTNAYSSVTTKIIKPKVFSATCWRLCCMLVHLFWSNYFGTSSYQSF